MSFTQRMANLDVPVIHLEMPPHQAQLGRPLVRAPGYTSKSLKQVRGFNERTTHVTMS